MLNQLRWQFAQLDYVPTYMKVIIKFSRIVMFRFDC